MLVLGMPSVTYFVGETAHLLCGGKTSNSPPDWIFQSSPNVKSHAIISRGNKVNGDFGGRLGTRGSTLVIEDVQVEHSGVYTCREDGGEGEEHKVVLIVRVHGKMWRDGILIICLVL